MNIAINTLPLLRNRAGAEQYTQRLIEALLQVDADNQYTLILSSVNQDLYPTDHPQLKAEVVNIDASKKWYRVFYEQCVLPFRLKKLGVDLLFSPCNIAPVWTPCPKVTMIFDMHWFRESGGLSPWRLYYVRNFIRASARTSQEVLTLSESSEKDLIDILKVPSSKISRTPVGETSLYLWKDKVGEKDVHVVKERYHIQMPYVMFLGQLLFRKNVDLVIQALAEMKKEQQSLSFQFVIAGQFHQSYPKLKAMVEEFGLDDYVIFIDHPEDDEVASLLKGALAFVYPSLYEGFGIPIMEAMYYELPVITSNVSSLPEVGGEACLYVNPRSVGDMVRQLTRVTTDEELRKRMIDQGREQVKQFTWKQSAQKTLEVFRRVKA